MSGLHYIANEDLKRFKTLLNEYGNIPASDERSKIALHDALNRLGSAVEMILRDIQRINEETPRRDLDL